MNESKSISKFVGCIYACLVGVSLTLYNSLFKMIKKLSIPEVILIRGLFQAFSILPLLIFLRNDARGEKDKRLLTWFSAFVNTAMVATSFFSVKMLPLGDAMAIKFSNPIIVMMLGHCFLKELCGMYKTLAVGLLLIGITLITKPPGLNQLLGISNDNGLMEEKEISSGLSLPLYYGYIVALSSTIGFAINTLLRKKLSGTTHFSVITFSCAITNMIASLVVIPLISSYAIPQHWTDVVYAMGIGAFSTAGQMFLMLSLQRLPAGMVSVLTSFEIVLAYLVQVVWFGESTDAASLVGAGVVVLSVFSIIQEENFMQLVKNCWKLSDDKENLPLINHQQHQESQDQDHQSINRTETK